MNENQIKTIKAYDKSAENFMKKIGTMKNYNDTYDFLIDNLNENDNVLDLACGPGQIGKYIKEKINVNITGVDLSEEMLKISRDNIPCGTFFKDSITTFKTDAVYDLVIIGFGIPYLNAEQSEQCIKNSVSLLKRNGYLYLSFMDGNDEGFEKTSFGGENEFYIYYHEKDKIKNMLEVNGIKIEKEYVLNYEEPNGEITTDIIYIGTKCE